MNTIITRKIHIIRPRPFDRLNIHWLWNAKRIAALFARCCFYSILFNVVMYICIQNHQNTLAGRRKTNNNNAFFPEILLLLLFAYDKLDFIVFVVVYYSFAVFFFDCCALHIFFYCVLA